MISNPCKWFINGNREAEFKYEGGKYLYHFCSAGKRNKVDTGWTDNYVRVNVIFFADSVEHARDVFKRMLETRLTAGEKYVNNPMGRITEAHAEEFKEQVDRECKDVREWLTKIDEAIFTLAPTNQLYVIGWADNDTIL